MSATLGRETGPTGDSAASRPGTRDRGTSRASEASRTTVPPGVSVK
ncbi:protein of unassigned function [Methylobacterium oryzae CBMB20]|uniref:Protein of unassigned function n=1 Tax=Methylobacterium oryzae CBMB20 TaxID=693986 RepID=A0A089NQ08_9HYPH|nr:protein of unassigned function [Methylobacterium oryzae CBMB20]